MKVALEVTIDYDISKAYNRFMIYNCDFCGGEFSRCPAHYKQSKNNYCSRDCYTAASRKRILKKCLNCGMSFETEPNRVRRGWGKYCSIPCRIQHKAKNKKTRKEIWTKYNESTHGREQQRLWHMKRAFGLDPVREDSACTLCGRKDSLIVHHRDGNNGKNGKLLNNDPANLVIICRSCHPKVHSRWGLKEVVPNEV